MPDEDDIEFLDDSEPEEADGAHAPWSVLVVDDDQEIHAATVFALSDQMVLGRPLAFTHAHSGAEARSVLAGKRDFAVILLDVVMESADAGLQVVHAVRRDHHLNDVQIILRTGQPGTMDEATVRREFPINDYQIKSKLTRERLVGAVESAVLSYHRALTANSH